MASIATVVTMGYGSFGSVNLLPTIGYGIATVSTVYAVGYDEMVGPSAEYVVMVGATVELDETIGADKTMETTIV